MKHIQEVVTGDSILCVNSDMTITFNKVIATAYCEDSDHVILRLDNGVYISNDIDMEYAECEMNNSIYVF